LVAILIYLKGACSHKSFGAIRTTWGKSSEAVTSRQATAEVLALKMFQKNLLMY